MILSSYFPISAPHPGPLFWRNTWVQPLLQSFFPSLPSFRPVHFFNVLAAFTLKFYREFHSSAQISIMQYKDFAKPQSQCCWFGFLVNQTSYSQYNRSKPPESFHRCLCWLNRLHKPWATQQLIISSFFPQHLVWKDCKLWVIAQLIWA